MKIDPADKAFSLYVRTRDNWTCQRCLKKYEPPTQALHCSHFQGRGKENTRFNLSNCDSLCHGCHRYFTAHPGEHYEWQVETKGKDKVDELILASNMYCEKQRDVEKIYWRRRLKEDFNEDMPNMPQ
jgi:hypothetical protein